MQTRANLCSICAPGACCAAVSCGFLLLFPAGWLLEQAFYCVRRARCVLRGACVLCMGPVVVPVPIGVQFCSADYFSTSGSRRPGGPGLKTRPPPGSRAPGPAASAGLSCTPLPSAVGVCRDAARGRPMCDEDEGALTSKEEVFAKTYRTSKKGLFGNIKHVLFCVASSRALRRAGRSPTQYPSDDENPRGLGFRLVRLQRPL